MLKKLLRWQKRPSRCILKLCMILEKEFQPKMLDAFESKQVEFMRGKIASGLGQGQYFISREGYSRQFLQHLGFVPFPGTLNVLLEEPFPAEQPGDQNRGLPGRGPQLWRVQMLPHQAERHRCRCGPARAEPLSAGIDRGHCARELRQALGLEEGDPVEVILL